MMVYIWLGAIMAGCLIGILRTALGDLKDGDIKEPPSPEEYRKLEQEDEAAREGRDEF